MGVFPPPQPPPPPPLGDDRNLGEIHWHLRQLLHRISAIWRFWISEWMRLAELHDLRMKEHFSNFWFCSASNLNTASVWESQIRHFLTTIVCHGVGGAVFSDKFEKAKLRHVFGPVVSAPFVVFACITLRYKTHYALKLLISFDIALVAFWFSRRVNRLKLPMKTKTCNFNSKKCYKTATHELSELFKESFLCSPS